MICACAPGTRITSRDGRRRGRRGGAATGAGPAGIGPKSRVASAITSAVFTWPLTASTMPPGT